MDPDSLLRSGTPSDTLALLYYMTDWAERKTFDDDNVRETEEGRPRKGGEHSRRRRDA